ncbi:NAD(P)/FAD-dependent oxidoreductase [Blastococcus sp. SYSU D00820]
MSLRRVVVAGGSIAALTAVDTLRAEGFDGEVTVLAAEGRPPYTRVPLSKAVLAGTAPEADVVLPFPGDGVDLRLRTPATGLDLEGRTVATAAGPVPFDGLVLATGARARRLGTPGQQEFLLRTVDDAARLRAALAGAGSVLVVGGGFLGMEIASTCAALGREVTVVDAVPPLDRLLGPVVGGVVRAAAERAGVRLVTAPGGVRLLGEPAVSGAALADGTVLTADLVVTAAGDVPDVEWLAGSGLPVRGGAVVDDRCRVAPGVVAAGDVAVHPTAGRRPTWTTAVEQGRVAALALLHGDDAPAHVPSGYAWTEQFGLDVKLVGTPQAGPPTLLDGDLGAGSALLSWPGGRAGGCVMAVGHPTPPARLKRLLAAAPVPAGARG